ncbi:histidine kinase [Microbulbifer variabilis]|uniref:histidine kinase n=1 Tax=Microbulbifer variabilis TaxID=266805 RepID=UPI0012FB6841
MLQQHVNPYFFNTLNSLYALRLMQSNQAAPMLLILSDLLRHLVYQGQTAEVALKDKPAYLQNYFELQKIGVEFLCRIGIDINYQRNQKRFHLY